REPHPRRRRMAFGVDRTALRRRDGKSHRRGSGGLESARREGRRAASLRQERNPRGPEDGAHHLSEAAFFLIHQERGLKRSSISDSDGRSFVRSFTCALNFSNCMTFSMRASRKAFVSASSSLWSVNQRIKVAE